MTTDRCYCHERPCKGCFHRPPVSVPEATPAEPTATTYRGLMHQCSDPECHVPGFVTTLGRKDDLRQCGCEAFDLDVTSPEADEDWCRCDHQRDAHDGHCQGVVASPVVSSPGADSPDAEPKLAAIEWRFDEGMATNYVPLAMHHQPGRWVWDGGFCYDSEVVSITPVRVWGPPLADQLAEHVWHWVSGHPRGKSVLALADAAVDAIRAFEPASVRSGEQQ